MHAWLVLPYGGGAKPISVSVPLQFDSYVVKPADGNKVAFNIWGQVYTTRGVFIQQHAAIAQTGSFITNEYGYLWMNWADHLFSWLVLEDNTMITFPHVTEGTLMTSSSIVNPRWNQRSGMRFSSVMNFVWVPASPYNVDLTMDATSKSKLLTSVLASAGVDTTRKVELQPKLMLRDTSPSPLGKNQNSNQRTNSWRITCS